MGNRSGFTPFLPSLPLLFPLFLSQHLILHFDFKTETYELKICYLLKAEYAFLIQSSHDLYSIVMLERNGVQRKAHCVCQVNRDRRVYDQIPYLC